MTRSELMLMADMAASKEFGATMQWRRVAAVVADHYEDLISQGKLREVKIVEYDFEEGCLGCGWPNDNIYPFSKYCPGCGNEVRWLDPKPIKR